MPQDSLTGKFRQLKVNDNGELLVTSGGGGGGGGVTDAQLRATPLPTTTTNGLLSTEFKTFVDGQSYIGLVGPTFPMNAVNAVGVIYDTQAAVNGQQSFQTLSVAVTGTWVGTIQAECSVDGIFWGGVSLAGSKLNTGPNPVISGNGVFVVSVCARYTRIIATAWTSGTATLAVQGSNRPNPAPPNQFLTIAGTVQTALVAGAALAADVGVGYRPNATNAAQTASVLAAASTNPLLVKTTPGRVIGWSFTNRSALIAFVKFTNLTTTPVPGTSPIKMTVAVLPNSTNTFETAGGLAFTTGIGLFTTLNPASTDATAILADGIIGTVMFA